NEKMVSAIDMGDKRSQGLFPIQLHHGSTNRERVPMRMPHTSPFFSTIPINLESSIFLKKSNIGSRSKRDYILESGVHTHSLRNFQIEGGF
ncbi:hypothetical protein EBQ74_00160, partial [bacterium]|nr:hypothetical protein [bacterium]